MYYPLSQITPNLYTNGDEFAYVSNNLPYTGYYFKTSTGKYYTGRTPSDAPNLEITFLTSQQTNTSDNVNNTVTVIDPIYYYLNKSPNTNTVYLPTYFPTLPTPQDYQNGEFRRYFCKKTNELTYIEINNDTYTKLITKDPTIEYSLYFGFNISWTLTGDKQKVAQTNKNIVEIAMKRQQLYKFDEYLRQDYTKYYQ
jgi:hypothetical protein